MNLLVFYGWQVTAIQMTTPVTSLKLGRKIDRGHDQHSLAASSRMLPSSSKYSYCSSRDIFNRCFVSVSALRGDCACSRGPLGWDCTQLVHSSFVSSVVMVCDCFKDLLALTPLLVQAVFTDVLIPMSLHPNPSVDKV